MKACPSGWHLPSDNEWQILVNFAGGNNVAGKKLKAKNGWEAYDFSARKNSNTSKCKWAEEKIDNRGRITIIEHDECTTDEYDFSALPGGNGNGNNPSYFGIGTNCSLWSSTEDIKPAGIANLSAHGEGIFKVPEKRVPWLREMNGTSGVLRKGGIGGGVKLSGSTASWSSGHDKSKLSSVRCLKD
jgi:hypothetical protein